MTREKAESIIQKRIVKLFVMKMLEKNFSEKLFTFTGNSDIIKYSDDQPRDENGRFTSGGSSDLSGSAKRPAFNEPAAEDFADAIAAAKASLDDEDAWRVDAHEAADYSNDKLFVTQGGSCIAIEPNGNIVSVCKMDGDNIRGSELLQQAVANGGDRLDAFGSGLYNFYTKNGFEPVSWTPFNEKYAPAGWNKNRDKPEPVIFYKHTGNTTTTTYENFLVSTSPYEGASGYDDAAAERDRRI